MIPGPVVNGRAAKGAVNLRAGMAISERNGPIPDTQGWVCRFRNLSFVYNVREVVPAVQLAETTRGMPLVARGLRKRARRQR